MIILFFIAQCSFGQVRDIDLITIEYDETGKISRESVKHFDSVAERLDLHFVKKHLYVPYNLPDSFENRSFKNDTVVIWHKESAKKDFVENWTNTYIYDSLSRVTSFAFSGCLVCSSLPFTFKVSYNKEGQVIQLEDTSDENRNVLDVSYNDFGEIEQLKFYRFDKLIRLIKINYGR